VTVLLLLKISFGLSLAVTALFSVALYFTAVPKDDKERIFRLTEAGEHASVLRMLDKVRYAVISSMVKPMVEAAAAPWRIPLAWEQAVFEYTADAWRTEAALWTARAWSFFWAVSTFALLYGEEGGWHSLIGWSLAVHILNLYLGGKVHTRIRKTLGFTMELRNRLCLAAEWVPPEYRGLKPMTAQQLEAWRNEVQRMELRVLGGVDPLVASNEAIREVCQAVDYAHEHNVSTDDVPSNRYDVLGLG
jgi:hypothetical protein